MGDGAVFLLDVTIESMLYETRPEAPADLLRPVSAERIQDHDLVGYTPERFEAAPYVLFFVPGDDYRRQTDHRSKNTNIGAVLLAMGHKILPRHLLGLLFL